MSDRPDRVPPPAPTAAPKHDGVPDVIVAGYPGDPVTTLSGDTPGRPGTPCGPPGGPAGGTAPAPPDGDGDPPIEGPNIPIGPSVPA